MNTKYGIWFVVMWSCLCLVGNLWAGEPNDANEDSEREGEAEQLRDLREELAEVSRMPVDEPATAAHKERIFAELFWRFARAKQTRFHISGTVVDSTGQPLEGVVAHYLVSRPISPTEVNYFGEAQQEVDGEFNIKTEAGLSAIVRFEKENYYPVERTFSAEELRDHAEIDIVAGKIPKRGKTKIQNIMVEMQKIGELTQLQRRSVTLRFSADGSGQIFDFGQPLDHARIGREVRVEDVTDPEQLPVKAAYVIADVDDDGKFLAKKVRYEDAIMNRRGQGWVPPNLRLVTMDSEGGFMLFISEDKVRGHDMAARKMAIAPEEEYEQVLELTPEIARRGHLFFFRMGGYYGRGKLDRPRLSADGTTFEIGVEFQIQTDGSRNLETMTWRH